jgi:tRNA modification GTPase
MIPAGEPTPFDTIFALATPGGAGPRAVLRVSGAESFSALSSLAQRSLPRRRQAVEAGLMLTGAGYEVRVPATLLLFPGPGSYTGEDVIEVHTLSSMPLVEVLSAALEERGLRQAWPGEFTRRAFENGKMDLAQAEAVIALIRARDQDELRRAGDLLGQGGAGTAAAVRGRVLALLALLESGLDFADGESGEVTADEWLPDLSALVTELEAVAGAARPGGSAGLPSFLLLGPPSAGKTSLWNALRDAGPPGLVAAAPGTTRDVRWTLAGGGRFRLGDCPGRFDGYVRGDGAAAADQELRIVRNELALVDGYVWVQAADASPQAAPPELGPARLCVVSKSDSCRSAARQGWLVCSARTGVGLDALVRRLAALGRNGSFAEGWESLMRGRLVAAQAAVARALAAARDGLGTECVVVDLREAAAALDPLGARQVPEAVLDRVFASFCLGK